MRGQGAARRHQRRPAPDPAAGHRMATSSPSSSSATSSACWSRPATTPRAIRSRPRSIALANRPALLAAAEERRCAASGRPRPTSSSAGPRPPCISAAPRPAISSCTARQVKDGDKVLLWFVSANRDETAFDDPFELEPQAHAEPACGLRPGRTAYLPRHVAGAAGGQDPAAGTGQAHRRDRADRSARVPALEFHRRHQAAAGQDAITETITSGRERWRWGKDYGCCSAII